MTKFKVRNSLAREQYVKKLVQQGVCHVKEMIDYAEHKLNPELISAIMTFVEHEISQGKFAKEDFEKSGIVKQILMSVFELTESEMASIDQTIQFVIDNELVKKKSLLSTVLSTARKLVTSVQKPSS